MKQPAMTGLEADRPHEFGGIPTERSSEPEFVFRKIVVVLILWAWDWPRISLPGTPGTPTLGLQPESVTSNPLINGLA